MILASGNNPASLTLQIVDGSLMSFMCADQTTMNLIIPGSHLITKTRLAQHTPELTYD